MNQFSNAVPGVAKATFERDVAKPTFDRGATATLDRGIDDVSIGVLQDVGFGVAVARLSLVAMDALQGSSDATLQRSGGIGSHVKIKVGSRWLLGSVRDMRNDDENADHVIVNIDFLGEGDATALRSFGNFRRGVTAYPRSGDAVIAAVRDDLAAVFATDARPHIEIGTVYPTTDVKAALFIDALLSRHFAIVGSTGTGKSTATALILHRIVAAAPRGHIVMLDPHGEYAKAFAEAGMIFNVDNLALPYWLMNFAESCEVFVTSEGADGEVEKDILAKCLLASRMKNPVADTLPHMTVDSPVPYAIGDLLSELQSHMGLLAHADDLPKYLRLKRKIEDILKDSRYNFMFSRTLANDSMASFLSRILRLDADGKPISIIDLSGVPSEVVNVVVALLSRVVFDFAIWSPKATRRPILLVCEEAHRYVPSKAVSGTSSVRDILERIAKEGRKYGVSLGLITQRPSDVAEGTLAQCGTIIAMRLNNSRDQEWVMATMPEGSHGFLETIPALRNRECIVCGEGVAVPVRMSFDTLAASKCPASDDPSFSGRWSETGAMPDLGAIIRDWRSQTVTEPVQVLLQPAGGGMFTKA